MPYSDPAKERARGRAKIKVQYAKRRAAGLCIRCGRRPSDLGHQTCLACRDDHRNRYQAYKAQRDSAGTCTKCGAEKPFWVTTRQCPPCLVKARAIKQAYASRHPDRVKAGNRIRNLRFNYGLEPAEYDQMFAQQDLCCAVCGTRNAGAKHWNVDHDHATGKVRGILCHKCNNGLGCFDDDPDRLSGAIAYLQKHRALVAV